LLEGTNDDDAEPEGLVRLLAGKYGLMNFIPYNAIENDFNFRRLITERAMTMTRHLHQHRIVATLLQTAGQDINGGCGQLRAMVIFP